MNLRLLFLTTTLIIIASPLQAMHDPQERINDIAAKSSNPWDLMLSINDTVTICGFSLIETAHILKEGLNRVGKSIENIKGHNDMTVLHYATYHGYMWVVKLLLSLENAQDLAQQRNSQGWIPLHGAAHNGNHIIVAEFLALPNALELTETVADGGWTPLHWAANNNKKDAVELFLGLRNAQALAIAKTTGGWTPLHYAAYHGHTEVAELFLNKRYAQVLCEEQDMYGKTPLHIASSFGKQAIVERIVALPSIGKLAAIPSKGGNRAYDVAASPEIQAILAPHTPYWCSIQ